MSVLESRTARAAASAKIAAQQSKAATTSIELLRNEQQHLRDEVRQYVDRDQADHDRLFASQDYLTKKVDEIGSVVSDVREGHASMAATLNAMKEAQDEDRRLRVEGYKLEMQVKAQGQLATIEVGKQEKLADVEDRKDTAAFRRKRTLKLWHVVSALIGLAGTVIGVLASMHC